MEILGLHLHIIILWWVAGVLVIAATLSIVAAVRDGDPYSDWSMLGGVAGFFAAASVLALILCHIPFESKYWHLYSVSGEVASVEATFNVDDGDITNSYVLRLEGDDTPYRLDDPRIKGATGDIDLTCSLEWVYQGADRVNCYIR